MLAAIKEWDIRILNQINNRCHTKFLDRVMPIVSFLGNYGYVWIFISFMLFWYEQTQHMAIQVILGLILTTTIGEGLIKHVIRRKRPFFHFRHFQLKVPPPITYSFPSGHTASAFCSFFILSPLNGWVSFFCFLFAVTIAFSRVYLKVHYPSDVVCGIFLGLFLWSDCFIYADVINRF